MEKLTRRQKDVLNFIKDYIFSQGYPPTVREICNALNISSTATIHAHLQNLEKKGIIRRDGAKNRAIELLENNENENVNNLFRRVPLIKKNHVIASTKDIEEICEFINIPIYLASYNKKVFALEINDNYLSETGILKKDIVIIEFCQKFKNNDYVAFINKDNKVVLRKNINKETYDVEINNNDLITVGKAIGLFRKI